MRGGLTIRSGRPGRYRRAGARFAGPAPVLVRGRRAGEVSRGTGFDFFVVARISFAAPSAMIGHGTDVGLKRSTETKTARHALRAQSRPHGSNCDRHANRDDMDGSENELAPKAFCHSSRPFCLALDSKYQSHPPASGNTWCDQMMLLQVASMYPSKRAGAEATCPLLPLSNVSIPFLPEMQPRRVALLKCALLDL
jgi:hypothetical protein